MACLTRPFRRLCQSVIEIRLTVRRANIYSHCEADTARFVPLIVAIQGDSWFVWCFKWDKKTPMQFVHV